MQEVLAAHSADGSAASKRESPFSLSAAEQVCPRFLPGHRPGRQTPGSSRLRAQSKRTNATLKPTLTTVSHGPQPRLARQWPLPWPETSRTGTRWNEKARHRRWAVDRQNRNSHSPIPHSPAGEETQHAGDTPRFETLGASCPHSTRLLSSSFPLSLGAL